MIYSYLAGRIGNNLFEIATAASHAKKMGVPFSALTSNKNILSFPDCCLISEYLQQFEKTILRNIVFQNTFPENVSVYKENTNMKYELLPELSDVVLDGYFQSEKYFDKNLVRDLFSIDEETSKYIYSKYASILKREPVSIVVRRGDYLKNVPFYIICKMPYFKRAINYFDRKTSFLVISDDIEWCKENFIGDNFFFVENESPTIDLYIQSMCKHNIISNSTFAWWGAWLNPNPNKIVLYPSIWMGPLLYHKVEVSDLCPPEWIPIRVIDRFGEFLLKTGLSTFFWRTVFFIRGVLKKIRLFFGGIVIIKKMQ